MSEETIYQPSEGRRCMLVICEFSAGERKGFRWSAEFGGPRGDYPLGIYVEELKIARTRITTGTNATAQKPSLPDLHGPPHTSFCTAAAASHEGVSVAHQLSGHQLIFRSSSVETENLSKCAESGFSRLTNV
uniref:Uncharacterized protein n=1 Tax=Lutzomyia longipalpis TaxID=7200 RepID=A0A1B0GJF2_LUTLO